MIRAIGRPVLLGSTQRKSDLAGSRHAVSASLHIWLPESPRCVTRVEGRRLFGSWGPRAADALIAKDGGWHNPSLDGEVKE